MPRLVNQPIPFNGTEEEREANFKTHAFVGFDLDYNCAACDCKPHHVAASYPCGQEPPRETVVYHN